MLFNYICINHDFKKLHEFFEHTVLEVWCKPDGNFNLDLLHQDFQAIVKRMRKRLWEPIEDIYGICLFLGEDKLQQLSDAFRVNNNIQDLCEGTIEPILYDDIERINTDLSNKLKEFCESLYNYVAREATFCRHYKSINDYYKVFINQNNQSKGKCPFCGLNPIKSELLPYRDAYDHYMPKGHFPFNTVNLQNLAPACQECNSYCKKDRIPIEDKTGNARKAFFPYSESAPEFEINVDIQSLDPFDPKKNQVTVSFNSDSCQDEVDRWRELYMIDVRYNDKCCSEDSKYWVEKISDEAQNYGKEIGEALAIEIKIGKKFPLHEYNFLKVPFLEAYERYSSV